MKNTTFTTSNYNRFRLNVHNRPLDEAHVKRLMISIQTHGLLAPIHCCKHNYIIDGQHRYAACKRLKHPLTVQVRDHYDMEKVVEVNTVSRKWTMLDFAHHFASLGNPHYVDFLKYVELYPNLPKSGIAMACALEQINSRPYKNGKLTCRDKKKTTDVLFLMEHARQHNMKCTMHYVAILRYVLAGHCVKVMSNRLNIVADNMKVGKPRNNKDALRVWQDIYNWKRRQHTIEL